MLKEALVGIFFLALLIGGAILMLKAMPAIHAECRTNSPQSFVFHSEGLCFGAYGSD